MKGIILAGGKGTRLGLLTSVLNKHLVGVGDRPMIEYPLSTLKSFGFDDISIVTGYEHVGIIVQYLTENHDDLNFTYKVQKEAGGIAQALGLTKDICKNDKLVAILGDNYFEDDFNGVKEKFEEYNLGAMLFLKKIDYNDDLYYVDKDGIKRAKYGIAELSGMEAGKGRIISIEEKPKNPKSNYAITGLYMYDSTVFDKIKKLKPSWRGEYEITDVNNMYIEEGRLGFNFVKGFWSDMGTPETKIKTEEFLRKKSKT